MKHLTYILALFLLIGCKSERKGEVVPETLSNTAWAFNIHETAADSILFFKKDSVKIYSCEIGEWNFGKYTIKGDSINCDITKGEYDYEFPEDSRHRVKPYIEKYLFNNSQLLFTSDHSIQYIKVGKDYSTKN